ncbi:MAG: CRTAC1 family protein [Candidatus Latescibacteria bacterium]|nr:CRTAC1 family protein [Candidatus Latescibacterota bacterium]
MNADERSVCRAVSIALLLLWSQVAISSPESQVQFAEVAVASGIDFHHTHGGSGELFYVETMGSGGGFLDYDGDGDLDIYLVNGASLPGHQTAEIPINRLYRNEGEGRFADATSVAGVGDTHYGMGCAAADFDNDGDTDLYVTNFGPEVLYRNEGNGTFVDMTSAAGVGDSLWSTSAAWLDYDNDGWLDLYTANYIDFSIENHQPCHQRGLHVYCDPDKYDSVPDRLYHNEGDGRFKDATAEAGLERIVPGRGLGVTCTDYDRDGDIDIYVANDETPNLLMRNEGNGRFQEVGLFSGVSHSGSGELQSGMGVDAGDYDGDGYPDLFVTNFSYETYTLYRNLGNGFFSDVSASAGLAEPTLLPLGFGTRFFDFDNDGDLDLFCANGHIFHNVEQLESSLTYAQKNQLLRNDGGWFADISASSGPAFEIARVSRGAAFGDYDDDGDVDILVTNNNGPAELLRNDGGNRQHWLTVRTVGTKSNRDGIGARLELWVGGHRQVREVISGASYLSTHDLRVHFGLGASQRVDRLDIYWPSGQVDRWEDLDADQFLVVCEGGAP